MSKRADTRDSSAADDAVPLERCLTRLVNPQRVAAVRERLPTPEIADELAATFRVLAEPARIKIVSALLEAGELCVCDLAASVGLSETATSQHLRILRAQRAVRNRREGRIVYYALADAHIRLLMDVTLQHVSHGDD
jgi:DNA-binding transcriptional ArsR family regulator